MATPLSNSPHQTALAEQASVNTDSGIVEFRSLAQWQRYRVEHRADTEVQDVLMADLRRREDRKFQAYCGLCDSDQSFVLPPVASSGELDLRETLVCPGCRLHARVRVALAMVRNSGLAHQATIYLTEQASFAYVWLKQRYPKTCGSEYGLDPIRRAHLEHWLADLGAPGPIVHADIMQLRFADASLDAITSFDVLEHVPDYHAALREFARCLNPGGQLLLTVPFLDASDATVTRARPRADGSIEHLLPPEIHGDPISGGALCFFQFGWDLLRAIEAVGFRDVAWCRSWQPDQAVFGLWTLRAVR